MAACASFAACGSAFAAAFHDAAVAAASARSVAGSATNANCTTARCRSARRAAPTTGPPTGAHTRAAAAGLSVYARWRRNVRLRVETAGADQRQGAEREPLA